MKIKKIHSWDLTPKEAIALQKQLAPKVKIIKPNKNLRFIAGVDCAFSKDENFCLAASVVWDKTEKKVIAADSIQVPINMPYIPGLLSFREAPAILQVLTKLNAPIDAIIVDGQGFAHPRRFGIASHLGLWVDVPTIGCAKSLLIGEYTEPAPYRGAISLLKDKTEVIGYVLRTRDRVKPVFVSIGNAIDLESAAKLILECSIGFRLPEPTRLADKLVAKVKADLIK